MTGSDVVRNDDRSRYELRRDGHLAELVFERDEDAIVLIHTGVPKDMEGHGAGALLVEAALADAAAHHLAIVPVCPFARSWLKRHPEAGAGVEIRWLPSQDEEDTTWTRTS